MFSPPVARRRDDQINGQPLRRRDLGARARRIPGPPPAHLTGFVTGLGHGRSRARPRLWRRPARRRSWMPASSPPPTCRAWRSTARAGGWTAPWWSRPSPTPGCRSATPSFDLVLCAETIEHVRDLQLLLSEIRRVLAPGRHAGAHHPCPLAPHRAGHRAARIRARASIPLDPHLRFLTQPLAEGAADGHGLRGRLDRPSGDPRHSARARGVVPRRPRAVRRSRPAPAPSAEVAAGEGAFRTCRVRAVSENAKSSSSRPSRPTAWARMPDQAGSRSAAVMPGT